jgi:hypothetical protein
MRRNTMLARRRLLTCILLALCSFYSFVSADGSSSESASDAWSTSTITHIEYNPLGLIKIEIPRISSPKDILEAARAPEKEGITEVVDFDLLFPLFQLDVIARKEYAFVEIAVVKIPFTRLHHSKMSSPEEVTNPEIEEEPCEAELDIKNPLKEVVPFDQPLFCLFDIILMGPREALGEQGHPDLVFRKRVLDSLVFCLYQSDTWGGKYYEKEWLDLPLVTTYARKKGENAGSVQLVEIPLATVYTHTWNKEESNSRFIDLLVASLYKRQKVDGKKDKWSIFETWAGTVVESKDYGKHGRFTVLETPHIISDWLTFSLLRKDRNEDGTSCNKIMRLPLIGPVWSSWKESDEAKTHHLPFPRLMFWKSPSYAR